MKHHFVPVSVNQVPEHVIYSLVAFGGLTKNVSPRGWWLSFTGGGRSLDAYVRSRAGQWFKTSGPLKGAQ